MRVLNSPTPPVVENMTEKLAGQLDSVVGTVCYPIGWAFLIWGVGMYLWTFLLYWYQTILVMRQPRIA